MELCKTGDRVTEEADSDVLVASDFEEYLTDHLMSEDELANHLECFSRHCEQLDWPLTEEQEEQNFTRFFSVVQEALLSVGSFSESRQDEADFTARRDVDPAHVLRVKTAVPVTPEVAVTTLSACLSLGSDYAVIFDGHEGRAVLFSNGDWVRMD
jgi:hypothetical protein